jgi:hypothetical protein
MRSHRFLFIACTVAALQGCATPKPVVVYQPVPAAYLEPCVLPDAAKIETTYDLEDAFLWAYFCAEQGNRDKERIRGLP